MPFLTIYLVFGLFSFPPPTTDGFSCLCAGHVGIANWCFFLWAGFLLLLVWCFSSSKSGLESFFCFPCLTCSLGGFLFSWIMSTFLSSFLFSLSTLHTFLASHDYLNWGFKLPRALFHLLSTNHTTLGPLFSCWVTPYRLCSRAGFDFTRPLRSQSRLSAWELVTVAEA